MYKNRRAADEAIADFVFGANFTYLCLTTII